MRHITVFFLLLLSFSCCAQTSVVPGGVVRIPLGSNQESKPKVMFKGNQVYVDAKHDQWVAIVGIPLHQKPGPASVEVGPKHSRITFEVHDKEYPAQYITLADNSKVTPNKEHLKRISRESKRLNETLTNFLPVSESSFVLYKPVKGRISGLFGVQRFYNGQRRSPHRGIDIAAPIGTPIEASASGVVTLVGNHFYTGNTVVIDHGQGLQTIYAHLDEVSVQEQQNVDAKEVIGTVGKTGRATGPHLHFGVILNQERIDPDLVWSQN